MSIEPFTGMLKTTNASLRLIVAQAALKGIPVPGLSSALAYLDIIRAVAERFPGVPLAAYNVSGEYAMVQAAAANGWLDLRATAPESLTAIRRAGASIILTYWATQAAEWLSAT